MLTFIRYARVFQRNILQQNALTPTKHYKHEVWGIKPEKCILIFAGVAFQHFLCFHLNDVVDEHQRISIRMAAVVIDVFRIGIATFAIARSDSASVCRSTTTAAIASFSPSRRKSQLNAEGISKIIFEWSNHRIRLTCAWDADTTIIISNRTETNFRLSIVEIWPVIQ